MAPTRRPPDAQPARRLEALDGLRGLAAVAIVVLHVWMFDHGDAGSPDKSLFDRVVGEGRIGVTLFFVLSGFLLFRPFLAAAMQGTDLPGLGRYALRRAARILPGYWLALFATFFLLRWLDHDRAVDASELPVFLLFLQNSDPATLKQLDPPMWTLCVEVGFYVVLPLIGLLALKAGPSRLRQAGLVSLILAGGLVLATLGVVLEWPPTVTDSLVTHLPEFAGGMLVAVLVHGRTLSRTTGRWLVGAGATLVLVNAWWHGYGVGPQDVRDIGADHPAVLGFALVLAGLTAAPVRARILTSRPVHFAGTYSFGIYLLHFPAIDLLRGMERWPEDLGRALLAVFAVTIPAAMASWYLVERPAMRAVRRRTRPARVREPQQRTRLQPEPARS